MNQILNLFLALPSLKSEATVANLRDIFTKLNEISKEMGPQSRLFFHHNNTTWDGLDPILEEETCAHLPRISDDVFRMVAFDVCEAALDKHDTFLEASI